MKMRRMKVIETQSAMMNQKVSAIEIPSTNRKASTTIIIESKEHT